MSDKKQPAQQRVSVRIVKADDPEQRSGMKPIHWVNSAPQLLQRMLRMRPGVTRIQRWRIILQESSQRQKGHFIRGFRREIGNVAMHVNASRSRSRAWRRGRRAFLRVG